MSNVMRKKDFCTSKNKEADQLRGNREADQRLCFRFTERTIPLLSESKISKPLAIFSDCTARFVADLVGNPEDRVSHNITCILKKPYKITCFMAQGNRTLLPIKSERCHEKTCFGGKIRISL